MQFKTPPAHCLTDPQGAVSDQERKKMKKRGDRYSMQTSLIVAALKRLLPVGLNICAPGDQELIALAKNRFTQALRLHTETHTHSNIPKNSDLSKCVQALFHCL